MLLCSCLFGGGFSYAAQTTASQSWLTILVEECLTNWLWSPIHLAAKPLGAWKTTCREIFSSTPREPARNGSLCESCLHRHIMSSFSHMLCFTQCHLRVNAAACFSTCSESTRMIVFLVWMMIPWGLYKLEKMQYPKTLLNGSFCFVVFHKYEYVNMDITIVPSVFTEVMTLTWVN